MDSQRLLLAPRSFLYAVEQARTSCSFRMAFASAADSPDSLPGFFLDISDVSAGRVMFIFLNTAPEDYVISHVYFDDGGANSDDPNSECRTTCELAFCGDGILDDENGEECDGADLGGLFCEDRGCAGGGTI